ncbi:hypothetical protein TNCV_1146241 [Trichonephila clavipes]|nr:hypothetical protein TNCV_1146241 [Trichonephila clavipes]
MKPSTRARELVESLLPSRENYCEAVDSLKSHFGREELLVEFYVQELLKLTISVNSKDHSNINKEAVAKMKYEPTGIEEMIYNLFGGVESHQKHHLYRVYASSFLKSYYCTFDTLIKIKYVLISQE